MADVADVLGPGKQERSGASEGSTQLIRYRNLDNGRTTFRLVVEPSAAADAVFARLSRAVRFRR